MIRACLKYGPQLAALLFETTFSPRTKSNGTGKVNRPVYTFFDVQKFSVNSVKQPGLSGT